MGFEHSSTFFWLKWLRALCMLALRSWGASLDIFIHLYRIPSGTICMLGKGGASEEINSLKLSWEFFRLSSRALSNVLSQLCIKWTFYKKSQLPFLQHSFKKLIAFSSCPWPMDILIKVMSLVVLPNCLPMLSTSFVGSTPGNSTKNTGEVFWVNLYVCLISNCLD